MGLAELYNAFDPLHPLRADEGELYVDWQTLVGADDVKPRLVNAIALSRNVAAGVLFTGHRGTGKTTELRRVADHLERGAAGRKHLVCLVEAEDWNDPDLSAEEIVLQIAIGLAERLRDEGFTDPFDQTGGFLRRMLRQIGDKVSIDEAKIEAGVAQIVKLTLSLTESRTTRDPLRAALRNDSRSLGELVNEQILAPAKHWLRERDIGDIVVIVDQLDRIPRAVGPGPTTNHERLFVDDSGPLRNLDCDLLYVIPIELAYSVARGRVVDAWGSQIVGLPVPPVQSRNEGDRGAAIDALARIVELRVESAGYEVADVFTDGVSGIERLVELSGGHPRTLFVMLRELVGRGAPPYGASELDRVVARAAKDMGMGLRNEHWPIIDAVHSDNQRHDDGEWADAWYELMQSFYVLAYEDDSGLWYDSHPLLSELPRR